MRRAGTSAGNRRTSPERDRATLILAALRFAVPTILILPVSDRSRRHVPRDSLVTGASAQVMRPELPACTVTFWI